MHMEFSDCPQDCLARAMEKHQMERSDLLRECDDDPEKESAAVHHADGCFDCNICLIFVSEPVVTLCGHLYCWPCIYKWMQVESMAARQCPVCKAALSLNTLVPLYGRGCPDSNEKANPEIPGRSSLPHHAMIASVLASRSSHVMMNQDRYGVHLIHEPTTQRLSHRRHGDYYSTGYVSASPPFRSRPGGMLGGLVAVVLPWTSTRNHEANMVHASPSRMQRQVQVESCLQQIWLFFFCCVVLCFFFL